jgi:hypothetical protein
MNGRNPAASLQRLQQQQQQQQQQQRTLESLAADSLPRTTVAFADKADDGSSYSGGDSNPLPLLQHLQEVELPATRLPNGSGAAVAGSSSAGDTCSDDSVDGSRVTVVQPTVAAVADEVGTCSLRHQSAATAATSCALSPCTLGAAARIFTEVCCITRIT